jgi:hypothetical protein
MNQPEAVAFLAKIPALTLRPDCALCRELIELVRQIVFGVTLGSETVTGHHGWPPDLTGISQRASAKARDGWIFYARSGN